MSETEVQPEDREPGTTRKRRPRRLALLIGVVGLLCAGVFLWMQSSPGELKLAEGVQSMTFFTLTPPLNTGVPVSEKEQARLMELLGQCRIKHNKRVHTGVTAIFGLMSKSQPPVTPPIAGLMMTYDDGSAVTCQVWSTPAEIHGTRVSGEKSKSKVFNSSGLQPAYYDFFVCDCSDQVDELGEIFNRLMEENAAGQQ